MSKRAKILIVEDDRAISTMLRKILQETGIGEDDIHVAEDAHGAEVYLTSNVVDLMLLDQQLPDKSGLDVLRHAKEQDPRLNVIMMSAFADIKGVLDAIDQGADDYMTKPFESIPDVVRKVRRGLEAASMARENMRLIAFLRQANEQNEEMARGLERKVEERTRELRRVNARLEELTLIDDLTGLFNQRFLFPRLEQEISRSRRYHSGLSVFMIDLDNFKETNDTHDHLYGSRVLARVAGVLTYVLRETDLIVRYGGDEFVVILPHTDGEHVLRVAERVRETLERSEVGEADAPWKLTVSIGVAVLNPSHADPGSFLREADEAMYHAKRQGKNAVGVLRGEHYEVASHGVSPDAIPRPL